MAGETFPGYPDIGAKRSPDRCFTDEEYEQAGIEVTEDLSECDLLLGIKEIPVTQLIAGKKYLFFSHTRKKQPHNQAALMHAMMDQARSR
jgi:saccharopine dehydrogenase (NAD+, L-lysine-forming)